MLQKYKKTSLEWPFFAILLQNETNEKTSVTNQNVK